MLMIVSERRQNSRKSTRPPRIRVPNNEHAVFTVDARKVLGVVKRISATGGSVILSVKEPAPHGTLAEMCLNTVYGRVTAQIEFLHTGADGIRHAQAFRFLDMDPVSRKRFTDAALKMQRAGFSDAEERQTAFGWASNGLSKVTQSVSRLVSNKKR